jgi:AcrR family transcriptional regulator
MAWDTAKTKQLLLEAAVEEFAEHGPQGARVDRIARSAGVNKERIYQYFGNKDGLFTAVLETELAKVAEHAPLTPGQAADLGEYAGLLFDYQLAHPHFLRLLCWEGLQSDRTCVAGEEERAASYRRRLDGLARAQAAGTLSADLDPGLLLYAVFALSSWWFATPPVARMLLDGTPAADATASRRAALVDLVNRLTAPRAGT